MIEGLLFWIDLGLVMYFCWRLIKYMKGESADLGVFSFKELDKSQ